MNEETTEQRLWRLERGHEALLRTNDKLLGIIEGTERTDGMKDTLLEVKREVKRIARLAEQLETLEELAVRKEELRLMDERLKVVERREVLNQGASIGRKGVFAIVGTALTLITMLLAILLQVSKISGGGAA